MGNTPRPPLHTLWKSDAEMTTDTRVGEVVEASTTEFVAQCYELHQAPPFGSLVRSSGQDVEVFGVLYDATTASIDPGRRPIARGREEESEEAIYRNNPQLNQLLRTDFRALVVGHRDSTRLRQYLPPGPAKVHAFVYLCSAEEVREFTASLDFLSLIASSRLPVGDELLAACIRNSSAAHADPSAFLLRGGKRLAAFLGNDLQRLTTILTRIRP